MMCILFLRRNPLTAAWTLTALSSLWIPTFTNDAVGAGGREGRCSAESRREVRSDEGGGEEGGAGGCGVDFSRDRLRGGEEG